MSTILQRIGAYAVKALPGNNNPPVQVRIDEDRLLLYPVSAPDPSGEEAYRDYINLGCALENAAIAANALGCREKVAFHFTLDENYVELTVEPAANPVHGDLLDALERLQVVSRPYIGKEFSAEQVAELVMTSREPDVFLRVFDTPDERASLLSFVEEAVVRQHRAARKDPGSGETHYASTWLSRLHLDRLLTAPAEVQRARELVQNAAVLLLFSTVHHNKEGWVNLGRSFQRIVLKAATMGISHSPLNMPCEEPSVRARLKENLGYIPEEPLLLVRFGYAEEPAPEEPQKKDKVSEERGRLTVDG